MKHKLTGLFIIFILILMYPYAFYYDIKDFITKGKYTYGYFIEKTGNNWEVKYQYEVNGKKYIGSNRPYFNDFSFNTFYYVAYDSLNPKKSWMLFHMPVKDTAQVKNRKVREGDFQILKEFGLE